MKFIIDAHLPRKMVQWLAKSGVDAVHTLDLPDGNRTTDQQIVAIAEQQSRVVVTKDSDFVDSHLVNGKPERLLLISTGNISNRDLEKLLTPLIPSLIQEFQSAVFLELSRTGIVTRG